MPIPVSVTATTAVPSLRLGVDPHAPSLGRVAQGVVHQDQHQLAQLVGVAAHLEPGRGRDVERHLAVGGERLHRLRRGRHELAEIERAVGGRAALPAGEREQRVDERREPIGLGQDLGRLLALGLLLLQELGVRPDHRQRRSQLVRGVGDEHLLALERRRHGRERLAGQEPAADRRDGEAPGDAEQHERQQAVERILLGLHRPRHLHDQRRAQPLRVDPLRHPVALDRAHVRPAARSRPARTGGSTGCRCCARARPIRRCRRRCTRRRRWSRWRRRTRPSCTSPPPGRRSRAGRGRRSSAAGAPRAGRRPCPGRAGTAPAPRRTRPSGGCGCW